jgi:CubicO group peptidase (beta-lactamase class C family)
MDSIVDDRANADKFRELIEHVQKRMVHFRVPGVALGLSVNGQNYVSGLGVTSLENPLPVTPETVFQIASITKTVTATAIFRLVEHGKVNLDDPIQKYIPSFRVQDKETATRATIRHLLNHTGGWVGDSSINMKEGDGALAQSVSKMADFPQLTPLGAFYAYNNASFNVAGRVIEIIMDKPYEVAIRELVLDPLKLNNSFFFPDEAIEHRVANGHYLKGNQVILAHPWSIDRGEAPCGGLGSNVLDLLSYARFHMGNGSSPEGVRLLTSDSLEQMQTPFVPTEDESWIGLNWFIRDIQGVRFISHSGSTGGQNSILWTAPKKKLAFSVLTNLEPGSFLCEELKMWVLKHFLGIIEAERLPLRPSPNQLYDYIGRYSMPPDGDLFELLQTEGNLLLVHTPGDYSSFNYPASVTYPPMRISLYAPDRFMITNRPFKGRKIDFLRKEVGKIAWLRFDGHVAIRIN